MKSSLLRTFTIFSAGAATAALASGLYESEPISAKEFQERTVVLLAEIELLGAHVAVAEDGRVGIYTYPTAACISPKPPVPVLPPNGVDIRPFERGIKALAVANKGFLMGDEAPVYEVGKCKPVEEFRN
ncbi:MAG TPA: hypothetical protein VFU13_04200 [Steroidobacteraceae bacterium]|nr:hypothetical protein [Steroidobacteraceae bacterium]